MLVSESEWNELLDLYGHLCTAAREGSWEQVNEGEGERQRLLSAVLASPPTDADAARLRQLLAMNREITRLAEAERDGARNELSALRKAKSAAHAYLQAP